MGFYDRQTAQALRSIREKGGAITWRKTAPSSGGTAAKPAGTTNTDYITDSEGQALKMVFVPVTQRTRGQFAGLADGEDIASGAEVGLMGRVNFVPSVQDQVIKPTGEILWVKDFNRVAPNDDEVILYKVLLVR